MQSPDGKTTGAGIGGEPPAGLMSLALEERVLERITKGDVSVPPYPAIATRVSQIVARADFDMKELCRNIAADQALAAEIIRMANSAAFRSTEPVTTLERAVTRIGTKELTRVVMALTIGASACGAGPLVTLKRRVWQEALISAVFCHQVGPRIGVEGSDAFIAGLLHDFGKTIALAVFEQIWAADKEAQVMPETFWREALERYHIELGMVVAAKWNLPDMLATVMAHHHDPQAAGDHQRIAELLLLSDEVAGALYQGKQLAADDLPRPVWFTNSGLRAFAAAVLPQIPPLVSGLEATGAQPKAAPVVKAGARPASAVAPSDTTLWGPRHPADFQVMSRSKTTPGQYTARSMTAQGLEMAGPPALPINHLAKLTVQGWGANFDIWANVMLCAKEGTAHRLELQLFGLDGPTQDSWLALFREAGKRASGK
ncbi:MAG: HDOD domain-containing protein [Deltaproteobacteria bacterium]|nr:HDOD domain-containing protein [Deltaproteobacteria bacterium]